MAFVFAVMAASRRVASSAKVSGSMSMRTALAPRRAMQVAVARKVYGVVTTSSPGPTPSAMRPTRIASVPEETPTACVEPE
jgi:hypothetical protein